MQAARRGPDVRSTVPLDNGIIYVDAHTQRHRDIFVVRNDKLKKSGYREGCLEVVDVGCVAPAVAKVCNNKDA